MTFVTTRPNRCKHLWLSLLQKLIINNYDFPRLLCRCPYGWLSACCPLLLGGGVGGGREKYCHYLFLYFYRSSIVCSATTPHPSFPKEGTTLGVDNAGARLPSFGGDWGL